MTLDSFRETKLPHEVELPLRSVGRKLSGLGRNQFISDSLYRSSMHLMKRKGKLIRPALVLLGAYLIGERPERFRDLAMSAELLHISSLIHDDIIDKDVSRRGVEAVHVKYGSEAAILAGDALISMAIGTSAKYGERVISRMSASAMEMCAGEMLDYGFQKDRRRPGVKEYEAIARLKSASLIATCCSIAAVYKKHRLALKLEEFGGHIGIAFQMRDDILEYAGAPGSRGGSMERKGFRPNIIAVLKSTCLLDTDGAIRMAVELQQKHMDAATECLAGERSCKLLIHYANRIRLELQ